MKEVKINSFAELIAHFEEPSVTIADIVQISEQALKVWISPKCSDKEEVIQKIKDCFAKFPNVMERPIFI